MSLVKGYDADCPSSSSSSFRLDQDLNEDAGGSYNYLCVYGYVGVVPGTSPSQPHLIPYPSHRRHDHPHPHPHPISAHLCLGMRRLMFAGDNAMSVGWTTQLLLTNAMRSASPAPMSYTPVVYYGTSSSNLQKLHASEIDYTQEGVMYYATLQNLEPDAEVISRSPSPSSTTYPL